MKTKHYYLFENKVQTRMRNSKNLDKNNWDILRMDENESPFSIEKNIKSYEENCKRSLDYNKVAKLITSTIKKYNLDDRKIISLGVGKAVLEWHIKNLSPNTIIECSDYTNKSMSQLKRVFPSINKIFVFDILHGDYSLLDSEAVYIMHRISTEFSFDNWCKIFSKMYNSNVRYIIFIPTGLDTCKTMFIEKAKHLRNVLLCKNDIFCGWLYSEKEFKKIFACRGSIPKYLIKERITFKKTAIYLLEKNNYFM